MTVSVEQKPREHPIQPIARWVGDRFMHLLFRGILLIPERALPAWGAALGRLFHTISRRHRTLAQRNLRKVYPTMPDVEIRRLAKQVFINFGKSGMEFLRIPFMSDEEIDRHIRLEGCEHLDAALARGKGIVMVSAHFGNWEMVGRAMLKEGYALDAIARKARHASTTQLMTDIRQSKGMRVIPRESMLAAVRSLKENRVLAILADQNDYGGIVIDFLGHPALTSTGPAALALMTGAAIVPMFGVRQADDTILGLFLPPILPCDTGDRQRDIRDLTETVTRIYEQMIHDAPDQWMWFHGRWKVPPRTTVAE